MFVVELPTGDGAEGTIAIQVQEIDPAVVPVAARGQRVSARATRSLAELVDSLRPVAERFVTTFQQVSHPPSEIAVQFGVAVSADADIVIARAASEANFSVQLTWKLPDGGADDPGSATG